MLTFLTTGLAAALLSLPGSGLAARSPHPELGAPQDASRRLGQGLWAGGFGSTRPEDSRWTGVNLYVGEVKGQVVRGSIHLESLDDEFRGSLREGELTLQAKLGGRKLRFSGRPEAGVLRGEVKVGGETEELVLVHEPARDVARMEELAGVYEAEPGHRLHVRRSTWHLVLEDLRSGELRALYCQAPDRYAAGSSFTRPLPVEWRVRFERDSAGAVTALELEPEGGDSLRATPVPALAKEEFSFASAGVELRGTLHLPPGEGPHPGIVWVHGSGRATRAGAGTWPLFFAQRGFAFLAVDKRGVGESGGTYELPDGGHDNLPHMQRRAGDVRAALAALREHERLQDGGIGLVGGSQAGWVIPMAAREGGVAFAITLSGGATALSYENVFSREARELETGAELPTIEEALERTRRHEARDPDFREHFAAMRCPALWLYGLRDRSNPSQLCIELLESVRDEHGKDFRVLSFPTGNHGLFECRWGGAGELGALRRKVPGMYAGIDAWLQEKELLP